jgi:transposase
VPQQLREIAFDSRLTAQLRLRRFFMRRLYILYTGQPLSKEVWLRMFEALADDPDFEYLIVDSTIVRAHQHASGAKGGLRIRPSGVRAAA